MFKYLILLIILFFNFNITFAASGNDNYLKEEFESILNDVTLGMGEYVRPDIYNEKDVEEIINRSKFLLYKNKDHIGGYDQFIKKLRDIGIDNVYLFNDKVLDQAICWYFGYDVKKHDIFDQVKFRIQELPGYYVQREGDGGQESYEINKIKKLKNGLMMAEGVTSEAGSHFKAFFKNSTCGGKEHWVLLKVVYTDINEESDDYQIPKDN